jgi:hypothetical protein
LTLLSTGGEVADEPRSLAFARARRSTISLPITEKPVSSAAAALGQWLFVWRRRATRSLASRRPVRGRQQSRTPGSISDYLLISEEPLALFMIRTPYTSKFITLLTLDTMQLFYLVAVCLLFVAKVVICL